MGAIMACRTAALGGHVEQCNDCGTTRIAYNSCRNRHCPKCQGLARAKWLADRAAELLPVPYFHVVFTLPAPVAEIAFHNKAAVYAILFRAAAETLITIAADPRHLGARVGITAVLHTWGQTLTHHPHVHCIVPGGGPSPTSIVPVIMRKTDGPAARDPLRPVTPIPRADHDRGAVTAHRSLVSPCTARDRIGRAALIHSSPPPTCRAHAAIAALPTTLSP